MQDQFSKSAGNDGIYIPREFLEKYPLIERAVELQKIIAHTINPDICKRVQPRMVQLIEDHVNASDADKQDLMVTAIVYASGGTKTELEAEMLQNVFKMSTFYMFHSMTQHHKTGNYSQAYAHVLALKHICDFEGDTQKMRDGNEYLQRDYKALYGSELKRSLILEDREKLNATLTGSKLLNIMRSAEIEMLNIAGLPVLPAFVKDPSAIWVDKKFRLN